MINPVTLKLIRVRVGVIHRMLTQEASLQSTFFTKRTYWYQVFKDELSSDSTPNIKSRLTRAVLNRNSKIHKRLLDTTAIDVHKLAGSAEEREKHKNQLHSIRFKLVKLPS